MMTLLLYAGALLLIIGAIAALCILNYLLSEVSWHARWNWGNARKLKRSVKLGWNTGEMPENKPILVREYAEGTPGWDSNSWSVMMRKGNRVFTHSGSNMPIKNITGWLEIVEDENEHQ